MATNVARASGLPCPIHRGILRWGRFLLY